MREFESVDQLVEQAQDGFVGRCVIGDDSYNVIRHGKRLYFQMRVNSDTWTSIYPLARVDGKWRTPELSLNAQFECELRKAVYRHVDPAKIKVSRKQFVENVLARMWNYDRQRYENQFGGPRRLELLAVCTKSGEPVLVEVKE